MAVKILYGAFEFGSRPEGEDQKYLDILTEHGVKDLDTAHIYIGSEKGLGDIGAPSKFLIHTKSPGFRPGALSKKSILAAAEQSFELLKTDSVETYFLHSPDPDTPIEEVAEAVQELYKAGRFKHFGLSNFKADQVRAIYDYAVSKDFVRPTVYQGNYNPVSRHSDADLFPLLRELKIAFYAYSPLAGGFLVKSAEIIQNGKGEGRWDPESPLGKMYHDLYNKPALVQALSTWEAIAQEAGISKAALAYRFVTYHSNLKAEYNDGIIIGASSTHQLEQTLKSIKDGPLDPAIVKKVDEIWEQVKHEAPVDNYSG